MDGWNARKKQTRWGYSATQRHIARTISRSTETKADKIDA